MMQVSFRWALIGVVPLDGVSASLQSASEAATPRLCSSEAAPSRASLERLLQQQYAAIDRSSERQSRVKGQNGHVPLSGKGRHMRT